jgi:hypothetical protein
MKIILYVNHQEAVCKVFKKNIAISKMTYTDRTLSGSKNPELEF